MTRSFVLLAAASQILARQAQAVRSAQTPTAVAKNGEGPADFDTFLEQYADECTVEDMHSQKKCAILAEPKIKPVPDGVRKEDAKPLSEEVIFNATASEAEMSSLLQSRDAWFFGKKGCDYKTFSKRFGLKDTDRKECSANQNRSFSSGDTCALRNVLFLYPKDDENNAFCLANGDLCKRLSGWYEEACSVALHRVGSVSEAMAVIKKYGDNSLKHVVLGGHGNGWALGWGPDPVCDEDFLCTTGEWYGESYSFLRMLSKKMQQHGSIFTDSCHSATQDPARLKMGMNFAQHVTNIVGRGVRVLGSRYSFASAEVKRFTQFYATIDIDDKDDVQTVYVKGAKCPYFAKHQLADKKGECHCPDSKPRCQTTDEKGKHGKCPKARGKRSSRSFLPGCAESWAKVKCECV